MISIRKQRKRHLLYYGVFALITILLMFVYLSYTLIHPTTPQQFPIDSFTHFPLTILIFPAEVFSFLFALYFVYSLFTDRYRLPEAIPLKKSEQSAVAILLPVYNEPKEIVERTIKSCKNLIWSGDVNIYILDDSSTEEDKKDIDSLGRRYRCKVIRRQDRIGYKAGNINNAVSKYIRERYFVILDSDQAPLPHFLEETVKYFSLDSTIGFVQTPQHFINDTTPLQRAAKTGTNIFYHAQCISKARDGAMPFCGTNAIIRTDVFKQVNGFSYYTATEDIELGIRINSAGYYGLYVPKILVHGYTPPDYKAYKSQQYRWANGNLAILRESWLKILSGDFSLRYQVHMFFTLGWWLVGLVTLIYILVPIIALATGLGTHHAWLPTSLLFILYLNVVVGIGMIFLSLHQRIEEKIKVSDAILEYILITNCLFLYSKAAVNAFFKRYVGFVRTSKKQSSSGIALIKWNLLLAFICFAFSIYALYFAVNSQDMQQLRTYLPLSLWLLFYSIILSASILFVDIKIKSKKYDK